MLKAAPAPQPMVSDETGVFIDRLLAVALPVETPWHNPPRHREELQRAYADSTLIVEATVTDESARISSASGQWINGWPEQYPIIIISVARCWRGHSDEKSIMIEHMRSGSMLDVSAFPDKYFRNGARCVFFLRPNEKVSKWSGRMVWDIVKGVPVKGNI